MGKLIYSAISSVDGFIEDRSGNFDWGEPDRAVFEFINELDRSIRTYLFGRRMYEVMSSWEKTEDFAGEADYIKEFAEMWKAAEKIVFSRTLDKVSTANTRLEKEFDAAAVAQVKASADGDLSVSGPELAAHAFRHGLVDECHLFLVPVVVGGGKPSLPADLELKLELMDQRSFDSGVVHLRYRVV